MSFPEGATYIDHCGNVFHTGPAPPPGEKIAPVCRVCGCDDPGHEGLVFVSVTGTLEGPFECMACYEGRKETTDEQV